MQPARGFTLIEVMVTIALAAIVLALAAPSFMQYIQVQRLKSDAAQLITDLQQLRSEAVSRNTYGRLVIGSNASMTCYTTFVNLPGASLGARCDCRLGPGSACNNTSSIEIRTAQFPNSQGVNVSTSGVLQPGASNPDPAISFDPVSGGLVTIPTDVKGSVSPCFRIDTAISSSLLLRTILSQAGRPSMCAIGTTLTNASMPACAANPPC
jgi:prepilin-type N-terminal cleavage/methylation domain-containing protein